MITKTACSVLDSMASPGVLNSLRRVVILILSARLNARNIGYCCGI